MTAPRLATCIVILPGMAILNQPPDGFVGSPYSFQFLFLGGVGPYHVENLSTLPAGWSLSTSGLLTNTGITAATSFDLTIYSHDANFDHEIPSQTFHVRVIALPLALSGHIAGGATGTAASGSYAASGGVPSYTFSVVSGTYPTTGGLSSAGASQGNWAAPGNYSWTVQVMDSVGTVTTLNDSVTIAAAPLSVSGTFTMNAKTGALDGSPVISGGTAPYFVSVHSGTSPPPITFGVSGTTATASGTCTTLGKYSWTLRFTDSGGSTPVDVPMTAMLAWYTLQFQAGGLGNVFDFNDLSTMYQDTAGTTPVTTVGQTIGSIRCKLTGNLAVLNSGKTLTLALDSTLGGAGYYCASVGTAASGYDGTDYILKCSGGVPSALLGDSVNGLGLVGLMEYDTGVQGVATFIGSYSGAGSCAATGNLQADGAADFLQFGGGYGVGTAYSNGKTYVIGSKGIRSGGSANIRVKSNANTQGASTSSIANITTGDFRIGAGISSGKKIYCAMAISREFTSTDYTNMPSQFFAL